MNALIAGYPNSGKTELFNALTNSQARVGNWTGVTVEIESAPLSNAPNALIIHDLPGLYSLMDVPESEDEKLALTTITQSHPNLIIHVLNACQLERQLFLTSELIELGIPMVVVLSMMKLANAQGIAINTQTLAAHLGCPVVIFEPDEPVTLIKQTLLHPKVPSAFALPFPPPFAARLSQYQVEVVQAGTPESLGFYVATQRILRDAAFPDADLVLANARYSVAHEIAKDVQTVKQIQADKFTATLDSIALNRYFGLPLFLFIMYSMFYFSIHVGGFLQGFFERAMDTAFVQLPTQLLQHFHSPSWLIQLLADGLGKGLSTTLTFIPVLGAMYFCLSFLEASGYMARAAFVMDRLMRFLGLPGKAFVPLIIGFGCNVPAILATRTLESKRDRYLTIFMSPFMSCSARLTIYTVFVSAFFPENGQNVIFLLYLLGIAVAILTGWMLQKTLFPSQLTPLLLELPAYHRPNFKRILKISKHRLFSFLKRAGQLILPICLLLSLLNLLPSPATDTQPALSLLAYLGQQFTPLFAPIGLTPENWPATVGLLTGVLAKEVVIGTLNTLYQQMGSVAHTDILIRHYFITTASVYAYLTFILLYLPCISTMAAIKQETSSAWMWFSVLWSFCVAYALSVLVFQCASFSLHPASASAWILGIGFSFIGFFLSLRFLSLRTGVPHAV